MSETFGLVLRGTAAATIVEVAGEIDLASRDQFAAAIIEALGVATVVVVDLTDVRFIDSSGLSALVSGLNAARRAGRQLCLRGASGAVADVLAITGLDAAFNAPPTDDSPV
jgi:anti-sigma B factor antagonist